jgi:hypothetical protein
MAGHRLLSTVDREGRAMTATVRVPDRIDSTGRPEYLRVIHECNGVAPGTFVAPLDTSGKWWAGGEFEDYPDARVIFRGDGSVSIVAKTERGDTILRAAAELLGITTGDTGLPTREPDDE